MSRAATSINDEDMARLHESWILHSFLACNPRDASVPGLRPMGEDAGGLDDRVGAPHCAGCFVETVVDESRTPRELAGRVEAHPSDVLVDLRPAVRAGRFLHHADL